MGRALPFRAVSPLDRASDALDDIRERSELVCKELGEILSADFSDVRILSGRLPTPVFRCNNGSQELAMKMLPHVSDVQSDVRKRFTQEIITSASVNHPHVVRGYAYHYYGDHVGYSMEYVSGGSLAEAMQHDTFDILRTVKLLAGICSGLAAIHGSGILHLDLKPENILLTSDGSPKIGDFGIASAMDSQRQFKSSRLLGSLAYMSPEQLRGAELGPESDIYAVGLIAFRLLTSSELHACSSTLLQLRQRLHKRAPAPSLLNPACDSELDEIVLKALDTDPQRRYASAENMFIDLLGFIENNYSNSGNIPLEVNQLVYDSLWGSIIAL